MSPSQQLTLFFVWGLFEIERVKRKQAARGRAYYERNREKVRARSRAWALQKQTEDPEYWNLRREKERFRFKERTYGVTQSTLESMVAHQGGKCPVCLTELFDPCVDHCHRTGAVRGILCRQCNSAIGLLQDSPENALRAAKYLGDTRA